LGVKLNPFLRIKRCVASKTMIGVTGFNPFPGELIFELSTNNDQANY